MALLLREILRVSYIYPAYTIRMKSNWVMQKRSTWTSNRRDRYRQTLKGGGETITSVRRKGAKIIRVPCSKEKIKRRNN